MPFDEGRLWKGDHGAELKRQLQATFQNITRVMDCVGCEKCKLWGKLQTLGEQLIVSRIVRQAAVSLSFAALCLECYGLVWCLLTTAC